MSLLPPPNPSPKAGSLITGWKIAVTITHLLIIGSLFALAVSSRIVGKPPWWLGPQAHPAPFIYWIVPFLGSIATIIVAIRGTRFIVLAGTLATVVLAVIGIADIANTPGIAIGEIILAGCIALTTLASLAGRRRQVTHSG